MIAVSVDTRSADADRFLASNPASFAIAYDTTGDTPRRYGVKAMPTSMLIDPRGRVVLIHAGFKPDDRSALESLRARSLVIESSLGRAWYLLIQALKMR